MTLILSPVATQSFGQGPNLPKPVGGYEFGIINRFTPSLVIQIPGKGSLIADRKSLVGKDVGISLSSTYGDGVTRNPVKIAKTAFSRMMSGEEASIDLLKNPGDDPKLVQLKAQTQGDICAIDLRITGGSIVCRKGAFIAAPAGTDISMHVRKNFAYRLFGDGSRDEFIMQNIKGPGLAFFGGRGTVTAHHLDDGEDLHVLPGHILAHTPETKISIDKTGGFMPLIAEGLSSIFGKKSLVVARVSGHGIVWVQSERHQAPRVW